MIHKVSVFNSRDHKVEQTKENPMASSRKGQGQTEAKKGTNFLLFMTDFYRRSMAGHGVVVVKARWPAHLRDPRLFDLEKNRDGRDISWERDRGQGGRMRRGPFQGTTPDLFSSTSLRHRWSHVTN